jgi:hypothetical protein
MFDWEEKENKKDSYKKAVLLRSGKKLSLSC